MVLIDYTTPSDIRAILGVTDEELEDSTLELDVYAISLEGELEDVSVNLPSQYATVSAISEASRTDAQRRFYQATRLFATYAVAQQLGSSLPMFGPKDISDGKATVSRFADSPYKQTLEEIKRQYKVTRRRLEDAFAAVNLSTASTKVFRTFLSVSSPSTDPVVE